MNRCHGCFSCIEPCGREKVELIINKEKEFAYYDAIGNVIITLNIRLQFQNPYLVYLGEL